MNFPKIYIWFADISFRRSCEENTNEENTIMVYLDVYLDFLKTLFLVRFLIFSLWCRYLSQPRQMLRLPLNVATAAKCAKIICG
jgi:hypothetical protein